MAKISFEYGTIVPSVWLNSVFLTAGGHKHDGLDEDGHAAIIELDAHADGVSPAHVSGRLPYSNLPNLRLFGFRSGLNQICLDNAIMVGIGSAASANSQNLDGYSFNPIIEVLASITKQVINDDGDDWEPFSPGNNGGGVPVGAAGWSQAVGDPVWLHTFLLGSSAAPAAYDVGFDSSLVAANLREESGFDLYRRIGSIKIGFSTEYVVVPFLNNGRRFWWKDSWSNYAVNIAAETITLFQGPVYTQTPPGVSVLAKHRIIADNTTTPASVCNVLIHDFGSTASVFPTDVSVRAAGSVAVADVESLAYDRQIYATYQSNALVDNLRIFALGWFEDPDCL